MSDIAKLLLRVVIGGLLLLHGIYKLKYGVASIEHILVVHHLPKVLAYSIFIPELIGAIFLIIGWKSRIWGLIISIEMMLAIYLTKLPVVLKLSSNGAWSIERELLFLVGGMVIALVGSGRYAIDR